MTNTKPEREHGMYLYNGYFYWHYCRKNMKGDKSTLIEHVTGNGRLVSVCKKLPQYIKQEIEGASAPPAPLRLEPSPWFKKMMADEARRKENVFVYMPKSMSEEEALRRAVIASRASKGVVPLFDEGSEKELGNNLGYMPESVSEDEALQRAVIASRANKGVIPLSEEGSEKELGNNIGYMPEFMSKEEALQRFVKASRANKGIVSQNGFSSGGGSLSQEGLNNDISDDLGYMPWSLYEEEALQKVVGDSVGNKEVVPSSWEDSGNDNRDDLGHMPCIMSEEETLQEAVKAFLPK